ncbi:MAG: chromosomal replication initiator protein DnaA [Pseudomonadota bacterium]
MTQATPTTPQERPGCTVAASTTKSKPNRCLNPAYTFETFVAGPSNQLAHAAARAVTASIPSKYNPLFICGGSGLGKTHLLHAIGHEILRQKPESGIVYVPGEQFVNEFIDSIRNGTGADFRRRYRQDCDFLLVDDIQSIANKEGTQQEFFHTFNALYQQGRQIVLSADRMPVEISDIAERLRTRFNMGLTADIEPPDLEMRVAILTKKAAAIAVSLPDDVSLFVAESVHSNVRDLEGALIRLSAWASITGQAITLDFAKQRLAGVLAQTVERISVEHILKVVASYYDVKLTDLKSERRTKSVAGPRAVAMYLARKQTGDSYPDLGRAFGNKHHTTVLSACEKIAGRLKTDTTLHYEINSIESLLNR